MSIERPILRNAGARRLFLHKHCLSERPKDLANLFDDLAFVQLDSINTVARAHHMIIHARIPTYRPSQLERLMVKERKVFEHWTHDASIISMQYFPYWRLRFDRAAEALKEQWSGRREGFTSKIAPVYDQIASHGPLSSSDVGEGEKRSSGGWWEWHPSKTALEYLWHSGKVAVCHRKGFRKYYDLCEKIIPETARAFTPSDNEIIDWACNAAVDRLGFATSGEIAKFFDKITAAEARTWCKIQLEKCNLIEIDVEDTKGGLRRCFARPDVFDAAQAAPRAPGNARILSPFDPALRDRARAERLFGFNYRIEIFVPEAQRIYGYYVFPVLQGDKIIGRIDMKATKSILHVTRYWPEAKIKMGDARIKAIQRAVERTARLAQASEISWADDWIAPPKLP